MMDEHRYYKKSKREQRKIHVTIVVMAVAFNIIVLLLSKLTGVFFLIFLSVAITLSVVAPFFDVPQLVKQGRLQYYSPLFLAEEVKEGVITIHGGTLFDYVFVIDRKLSGRERTNLILRSYLEGLINLIEEHTLHGSSAIRIRATSYILNERTARKIGLQVVPTDFLQKIILIYNYVNLTFANSIAKARFSPPSLTSIKAFEGDMDELIKRRNFLQALKSGLDRESTLYLQQKCLMKMSKSEGLVCHSDKY